MPRRLVVLCGLAAVIAGACRPDTVRLAYRFSEGTELEYRMHARASASWDIEGSGSGSYEVTFDVTERIESQGEQGALISVAMTPVAVDEEGLASPGGEERSFSLRISNTGQLLEVVEVDGVAAQALNPDELAFIGAYRPPLPEERVALHDTWESRQELQVGPVFQQLVTLGELESLYRHESGAQAEVSYSGEGPLVWSTELPQGEASLTGSATTTANATLSLSTGSLRSARSSTVGDFDVRVVSKQDVATPLAGSMRLRLDLQLQRLD